MHTLVVSILALTCFTVYAYGDSQFVCKRIGESEELTSRSDQSYNSKRYRNKPGHKGKKGETGIKGEKGKNGFVDHELIIDTTKDYVEEMMNEYFQNENTEDETTDPPTKPTIENCSISYNNKCFVPQTESKLNLTEARELCANMSGQLANIQGKRHFDLIMETVRSNYMEGLDHIDFRIGLKILLQTRLTDGRPASYLRWYEHYPINEIRNNNIFLRVKKSSTDEYQYLYNNKPSHRCYTLCEI